MMKPLISVNLCTYNRLAMLKNTLESLVLQVTGGEFAFEIIVVDDGSSDGTSHFVQEMARESVVPIRYVREDRAGVVGARNRGVRESQGEWLAFIDDDEIAAPDWLRELLFAARTAGADCSWGVIKLILPEGSEKNITGTSRKHLEETSTKGWLKNRLTYSGPGTCNCLVKKDVFREIGDFRLLFTHRGEDQDFFRRARKAGFKIVFAPQACISHIIPGERLRPEYLLNVARLNGTTIAYLDRKEWGNLTALLICALRIIHAVCVTLPGYALAYVKGDSGSLLGWKCSFVTAKAYVRETLFLSLRGLVRQVLPSRPPLFKREGEASE
jgi:succinoglycan biosynthesis protein ExoM